MGFPHSHFEAFSDSDLGNEPGKKSTSGNLVCMGGSPVYWKAATQRLVALSTAESELISLTQLVREMKFISKLVKIIFGSVKPYFEINVTPCDVKCDNTSAIYIAHSEFPSTRTKHLDLRHAYCYEQIKSGLIRVSHVSSAANRANCLTKPCSDRELLQLFE